jgi:hypothetical protein
MPMSDRAFHALAHARPDAVTAVLRVLVPDLASSEMELAPVDPAAARPGALAPLPEADRVAPAGPDALLHVGCQGDCDPGVLDQLLRDHLALTVRHWPRRVETVALWLRVPSAEQARAIPEHGGVSVGLRQVVVPQVPAGRLLASPATAWLAAGADAGTMGDAELCRRVARALREGGADCFQQHLALMAAALQGRYREMMQAMEQEQLHPAAIIEDLVLYGLDQGLEKGLVQGLERGLEPLVRQLARKLGRPVRDDERQAVQQRLSTLGAERLGDVVLDLSGEELATWLADPDAK